MDVPTPICCLLRVWEVRCRVLYVYIHKPNTLYGTIDSEVNHEYAFTVLGGLYLLRSVKSHSYEKADVGYCVYTFTTQISYVALSVLK